MPSGNIHTTTGKSTTYICLDTNIVIDCAYARGNNNSFLLDKILEQCSNRRIKLLIPEVILLELEPASRKEAESVLKALNEVSKAVEGIEKSSALYGDSLSKITTAIKTAKQSIRNQVQQKITNYIDTISDEKLATRITLSHDIIIEAVKIAIADEKPSKSKSSYGILQDDCLIVASLEEFIRTHPSDRVIFCSRNTKDFTEGGNKQLHNDIRKRLKEIVFYSNPVKMLQNEFPTNNDNTSKDTEGLENSYKTISARPESLNISGFSGYIKSAIDALNIPKITTESMAVANSEALNSVAQLANLQIPTISTVVQNTLKDYSPLSLTNQPALNSIADQLYFNQPNSEIQPKSLTNISSISVDTTEATDLKSDNGNLQSKDHTDDPINADNVDDNSPTDAS